jgi:hypothetical protein
MSDENVERMLRTLNQTISQLNQRLTSLESRLGRSANEGTIIEERVVPEAEGLLGGRAVLSSQGGIQKITYVPVCDYCHSKLDDNFVVCSACGKKLCHSCTIFIEGKNLCPDCFNSKYPLSRECFKVLNIIQGNVAELENIAEIIGMSEEEVHSCIRELIEGGYLARQGVSIFSKIVVTQKGFTALLAHDKLFEKDVDMEFFKRRLEGEAEF